MKPMSDDEWLARARARQAHGDGWETPGAELFAASPPPPDHTPARPRCPYCPGAFLLTEFHPDVAASQVPLLYCRNCYGFWAAGDSLSQGFESEYVDAPALLAAQAPPRCRSCFGYLKPDGVCAKCGKSRPPTSCPACGKEMQRFDRGGVTLDACDPCHGIWFDMGELAAVYGLQPGEDQPLPGATTPPALSGHGSPWLAGAFAVARALLPFAGL
jgi:hypothetical protein